MKRNFVQVAEFLKQRFPDLDIRGELARKPPLIELCLNILSYLQLAGMIWMILGGEKLFAFLGYDNVRRPLPRLYWFIQENSMMIAFTMFFGLPQLLNSFGNNNAFELFLDGQEIFSRIKSGGMPTGEELIQSLTRAGLKMTAAS